jgi:hypothetical protein
MADRLEALLARGLLTALQCRAAQMWRGDYLAGDLATRARGSQPRLAGGRLDQGGLDMRAVARRRFRQAAIRLGPVRQVCQAVVIEERATELVALELGEDKRAILPMVRRGLEVLVPFYGVGGEVTDRVGRGDGVVDECAVDC